MNCPWHNRVRIFRYTCHSLTLPAQQQFIIGDVNFIDLLSLTYKIEAGDRRLGSKMGRVLSKRSTIYPRFPSCGKRGQRSRPEMIFYIQRCSTQIPSVPLRLVCLSLHDCRSYLYGFSFSIPHFRSDKANLGSWSLFIEERDFPSFTGHRSTGREWGRMRNLFPRMALIAFWSFLRDSMKALSSLFLDWRWRGQPESTRLWGRCNFEDRRLESASYAMFSYRIVISMTCMLSELCLINWSIFLMQRHSTLFMLGNTSQPIRTNFLTLYV